MAAFGFTPASGQDFFSCEADGQSSSLRIRGAVTTGEEARQFYENLVKDGDQRRETAKDSTKAKESRSRARRRERRRVRAAAGLQTSPAVEGETRRGDEVAQSGGTGDAERIMELQGLRLLHCAHEGNVSGLKDLLSKGTDINFQDTFFWTAMMCACWSGQRAAVRLLLQRGAAWVGVVDTRGRDARELAQEAGHAEVLEELDGYGRSEHEDTHDDASSLEVQRCDLCGTSYSSSLSTHLTSTLHQFSLHRPPPTPFYCLPPNSNSYKMMVRCGWKPGTGLGAEGEGTHNPVATVLKRDHKGLGYGHTRRARITHFQARDRDAVKAAYKEERVGKGKRKEKSRMEEERDKNWERDFRASFYL